MLFPRSVKEHNYVIKTDKSYGSWSYCSHCEVSTPDYVLGLLRYGMNAEIAIETFSCQEQLC